MTLIVHMTGGSHVSTSAGDIAAVIAVAWRRMSMFVPVVTFIARLIHTAEEYAAASAAVCASIFADVTLPVIHTMAAMA